MPENTVHVQRQHDILWMFGSALLLSSLYIIEIWDYDDWWHLATGRWIVEHGSIPRTDPFSYTAYGQSWPGLPWLGELTFYGAYCVAGVAGMVLVQVLCAFATLSLTGLALRELEVDRRMILAQMVLVAVIVQERYARSRPETLGAVLLALAIYLFVRWWKRRDKGLIALGFVVLVWIPTHGSAVLGVALAGVVGAAALTSTHRKNVWIPFASMALGLLCFGITRTGREVIDLALRAGREASPVAIGITEEWRAPTLRDGSVWLPLLLTGSAMVYAMTKKRELLVPLGLAAVGVALTFRSIRHIAPAVLMSTPVWGIAGKSLLDLLHRRQLRLASTALPFIVGLGLPLAHLAVAPFEQNRIAFGFGVVEDRYPVDTVPVLEELPPGRTVHDMHLGGYLIWRRIPVFWDGRTVGLYSDKQIAENFLPAGENEAALDRIADQFEIHYGLVDFLSPLGVVMMTSNQWIPVHYGDRSAVFVRRKYGSDVLKAGLPLLTTLRVSPSQAWNDRWYGGVLSNPVGRRDLARSIGQQAGRNQRAVTFLAALRYLRERQPEFFEQIQGLLEARGHPWNPNAGPGP